ncbi:hypothetical protein RintRC_5681 [Richelia intracellularis]|nr:hypothetical protein RintRC_5681 [Richelia intracellularis]
MLPQLVREIVIENAIADITLSEEENSKAYQLFYQGNQLTSEPDVEAWLTARNFSRQYLDYLITRSSKLKQFKENTWGNKLESYFIGIAESGDDFTKFSTISQLFQTLIHLALMQRHFIQRKSKLEKVIYSLIRLNDIGIAQELYFRIKEGEQSFDANPREYFQGQEANTGRLLGPVELSVPHPVLAKIIASNPPGKLLPPTRVGEWIVIIRVEQFLPAQLDEGMQQRLLNELLEN